MLRERFCVKRGIVFAACVLVPAVLAAAGTPGARNPVGFTLAATWGEPAPISFTLATRSPELEALAGPGGLGVIEDPGAPFRTALGFNALASNTSGLNNTAVGYNALPFDVLGSDITAIGANALGNAGWAGNGTTAIGAMAMGIVPVCEVYNTAIGYGSSQNSRGPYNTAVGAFSGVANDWGQDNTAMGYRTLVNAGRSYPFPSDGNTAIGSLALESLTGFADWQEGPTRYNTALGYKAGSSVLIGEFNIFIGANQSGVANDTNTIRIGTPYSTSYPQGGQNRTFISGIVETPLTSGDGPAVVGITGEGRLGTMSSDLLPPGPQGPQGIQGPQGPAGEGLVPGSLLFLPSGFAPPAGYAFLGITEFGLTNPVAKKVVRFRVNVYQKL